jgi:hypothetical protein
VLTLFSVRSVPAAALDVQACLSESEKGQRARSAGKLREARDHFVQCGSESCPALVRRDCAEWATELAQTLPSVVFGARDKKGRDLFDVTVSVDGDVVVQKLDGKGIPIDPGKHTFRFEAPGFAPVIEVALVKEGERARVFNVTFDAAASASKGRGDVSSTKREHTIYPWLAVAAGAAGVVTGAVIVLTSPDHPAGCDEDTKKCVRLADESDADFTRRQEDAGVADGRPVLGLIVGGIGLAVAAGGLVWHFLEPTWQTNAGLSEASPSGKRRGAGERARQTVGVTRSWRVMPWTTERASGIAVGGAF